MGEANLLVILSKEINALSNLLRFKIRNNIFFWQGIRNNLLYVLGYPKIREDLG